MEAIINCSLDDLKTESDVEQKFILPLLTSKPPFGLNYNTTNFQTKPNIKGLTIDKGSSSKLYYPDYVIINSGLPLLIIEAKKPGEDLLIAYREARLYCGELNAQFPNGINPCHKIIVSDGSRTIAGFYDSNEMHINLSFDKINTTDPEFYNLSQFAGKEKVFDYVNTLLLKLKGNVRFLRPLSMLGGKTVQNEQLNENTFGSTLSLEFRYLFNPESYEERKNIVLNAYVKTRRHLKQVDPIDKIIRATLPLSLSDVKRIEDTSQPVEIIRALKRRISLKNQLLLLIGSVGSGKSTFTDYLREVALSSELKEGTVWISLNLNNAPLSRNEIYTWLKQQLIEKLKEQYSETDFDDFHNLKKVYSTELNAVKKTYSPILGEESIEYKKIVAETIQSSKSDLDLSAKVYTRYLCSERAKLLIIVLDNTDKRVLQDQLLMFEVASWLKETFNCLVFLPLRDTTFDNFRKQPPLDTVINDFVFRIDPPLLREVIMERIKYALREMSKTSSKLSFTLPNGISVEYPASDQGYYLASIAKSLFESVYFNRLITGLAGRDIRKGLGIFLDFCKSGHINETEIYQIKRAKGQYSLPNYLICRIILRGNKKYYAEAQSDVVKNIFTCFFQDTNPDPFVRLSILRWLEFNFKKAGPTKNIGYHKVSKLINEIIPYGHSEERIKTEIDFLIKNKYIVTESQAEQNYELEDLVSISPSGLTLLLLLDDVNYLAACSEDIYYRDPKIAEAIHFRISERSGSSLYSVETMIQNADALVSYLDIYKENYLIRNPDAFLNNKSEDFTNLEKQKEIIKKYISKNENLFKQVQYPHGTEVDAEISSIKDYGVFVEFGLDAVGFLHISEFNYSDIQIDDLEHGDILHLKVKKYNSEHHKYELEFMN